MLQKIDGDIVIIPGDLKIGYGISLGDRTVSGASHEGQAILREVARSIREEQEADLLARLGDRLVMWTCIVGYGLICWLLYTGRVAT